MFFASTFLAGRVSADINQGLALYYSFDEEANLVVPDQSSQGNNGTLNGNPVFTPDGKVGGALEFDGQDDRIFVPASSSLNVGTGGQLTFAAWYLTVNKNVSDPSVQQNPILEYSSVPGVSGCHMWANTIGFQWFIGNGANGGTGANLVDTSLNDFSHVISAADQPFDEWHHLAVTYDQSTGIAKVYIDGILKNQANKGSFVPKTDLDLQIGQRLPGLPDSPVLKGLLDEIRIYNRALNDQEVDELAHPKEKLVTKVGFSKTARGLKDKTQFFNIDTMFIFVQHVNLDPAAQSHALIEVNLEQRVGTSGTVRRRIVLTGKPDGSFTGSLPLNAFKTGKVEVKIEGCKDQNNDHQCKDIDPRIMGHLSNITIVPTVIP